MFKGDNIGLSLFLSSLLFSSLSLSSVFPIFLYSASVITDCRKNIVMIIIYLFYVFYFSIKHCTAYQIQTRTTSSEEKVIGTN